VLDVLVGFGLAWESCGVHADDGAGRVVEVPPVPAVTVSPDPEPKRLEMRLDAVDV
jgi:hypothetical protein